MPTFLLDQEIWIFLISLETSELDIVDVIVEIPMWGVNKVIL